MVIAFVGLSNKPNKKPLDKTTKSGVLIGKIIEMLDAEIYLTNLCKFAPLNEEMKLIYPSAEQMNDSVSDLMKEIDNIHVNKVFLLGQKVCETVGKFAKQELKIGGKITVNGIEFIGVKHPAYIMTYKQDRKDEYINEIVNLCKQGECR